MLRVRALQSELVVTRPAADVLADLAALAARQAELTSELAAALRAPAPAPLPASAEPAEYLTTAEAAALLGVSVRGLEDLRRAGRGPSFVRIGRMIRYPRPALVAQNTVQLPSSAAAPAPSSAAKSR